MLTSNKCKYFFLIPAELDIQVINVLLNRKKKGEQEKGRGGGWERMGREGEEGAEAHLYEYEFWRQHIAQVDVALILLPSNPKDRKLWVGPRKIKVFLTGAGCSAKSKNPGYRQTNIKCQGSATSCWEIRDGSVGWLQQEGILLVCLPNTQG